MTDTTGPAAAPEAETTEPPPAERSRPPLGSWFVLGGGIAVTAGAFLPWVNLRSPYVGLATIYGVDSPYGWVAALGGLVITVCGAIMVHRPRFSIAAPIAAAVTSLGLVALATWVVIDLQRREAQLRADIGYVGPENPLDFGRVADDMAAVMLSPGSGLRLVVFAGLVAAFATSLTRTSRG